VLDDVGGDPIGIAVDRVPEQRQRRLRPLRRRATVGAARPHGDDDPRAAQAEPDRGAPRLGDRRRIAVIDHDRDRQDRRRGGRRRRAHANATTRSAHAHSAA
jgi:hypothetical protein